MRTKYVAITTQNLFNILILLDILIQSHWARELGMLNIEEECAPIPHTTNWGAWVCELDCKWWDSFSSWLTLHLCNKSANGRPAMRNIDQSEVLSWSEWPMRGLQCRDSEWFVTLWWVMEAGMMSVMMRHPVTWHWPHLEPGSLLSLQRRGVSHCLVTEQVTSLWRRQHGNMKNWECLRTLNPFINSLCSNFNSFSEFLPSVWSDTPVLLSALVCNQMTSCAANPQKKQTSAVLRPEFIDAQQLRPCYIDWIKIKRYDPWIPTLSLTQPGMSIYQDWGLETISDQPLVSEGCRPMNGNGNVWLLIGTNTSEKQNALDNWINTQGGDTN